MLRINQARDRLTFEEDAAARRHVSLAYRRALATWRSLDRQRRLERELLLDRRYEEIQQATAVDFTGSSDQDLHDAATLAKQAAAQHDPRLTGVFVYNRLRKFYFALDLFAHLHAEMQRRGLNPPDHAYLHRYNK